MSFPPAARPLSAPLLPRTPHPLLLLVLWLPLPLLPLLLLQPLLLGGGSRVAASAGEGGGAAAACC